VRAAQGEIPHPDFVSLQPPLSFYTTAGVFKLFGTSLASLRIFGLLIFLLLPLLIYGVGRSFAGPHSRMQAGAATDAIV
jgi:4-amino-4-deoxy-L-arabinose transferase-like glycosyltransferase